LRDLKGVRRGHSYLAGIITAAMSSNQIERTQRRETMSKNPSSRWDIETDIAIVGYGGAGASAAITAHDIGAKVIILEKMPKGGGNTALGPSSFFSTSGDKVSQVVEYFEKSSFGNTDRPTIQAYVEEAVKNKEWIEQLGGTVHTTHYKDEWPWHGPPAWPHFPGAEAIGNGNYVGDKEVKSGGPLWALLSANVEKRGIKVMISAPAKELVTNDNGEVIGVIAEQKGKRISIKANQAVILTSGGFASSEVMRSQYLPFSQFLVNGSPGNTGDGITMAVKVGAALWHMTVIKSRPGFKSPDYEFPLGITYYTPRFVWVNKFGRRFTTETGWEAHMLHWAFMRNDPMVPGYPHLPFYGISDSDSVKERLCRYSLNSYEWSKDNSVEIAKGWIKQANTIRELARQIGVDEATLEDTVSRFNQNCKLGIDPEHGRLKDHMAPIDTPPYYGIELWPQMANTLGGPRHDYKARVVDLEGKPIPRLYAAGELGSFQGFLYSGGTGMGEPLAVGRIAGRYAAEEEPWC
jgi:succinate dehydrogenase/fumarate reductase flavoprotein subunit